MPLLPSPFGDDDLSFPQPPMPGAPPPPPPGGPQPLGSGGPSPLNFNFALNNDGEGAPAEQAPGPANVPGGPAPGGGPAPAPPAPTDSRCPPKNGIKRFWDEGRQRCVYMGGCPPGQGYVMGKQGCQQCPPGTTVSEQGRCLPGLNGEGGGGGGGGRGGGGGAPGGAPLPPLGPSTRVKDFNADLEEYIRNLLESPSRFTPEIMQALYGQIASQSSGQIARGEEAVRAEAARTGSSRFGQTQAAMRDVRATAESQRGQATVGVQLQKINTDYQDRMGALDRAQKYLDSLRDSEYRYALLGEQRRQFDANLALAYANLAQNRTLLEMQLQSAWDMMRAMQGYSLLGGGV